MRRVSKTPSNSLHAAATEHRAEAQRRFGNNRLVYIKRDLQRARKYDDMLPQKLDAIDLAEYLSKLYADLDYLHQEILFLQDDESGNESYSLETKISDVEHFIQVYNTWNLETTPLWLPDTASSKWKEFNRPLRKLARAEWEIKCRLIQHKCHSFRYRQVGYNLFFLYNLLILVICEVFFCTNF